MILTGKARKDFEEYLESDEDILCGLDLYQLNNTCINALIIDWLDTISICISIVPYFRLVSFDDYINVSYGFSINLRANNSCNYRTRNEAINEAIKDINIEYNGTN